MTARNNALQDVSSDSAEGILSGSNRTPGMADRSVLRNGLYVGDFRDGFRIKCGMTGSFICHPPERGLWTFVPSDVAAQAGIHIKPCEHYVDNESIFFLCNRFLTAGS
jgi:hypothetical protein